MLVKIDKYKLPKRYKRNGQSCFLDPCRKIFLQRTPEEDIRQKTIMFLVDEMKVPIESIDTEVPMSYFTEGAAGRADIVVYDTESDPMLIIECKSKDITLIDDVFEQVYKYAKISRAKYVMVTNGFELFIETYSNDTTRPLSEIPIYKELHKAINLKYEDQCSKPWKRLSYAELSNKERIEEAYNHNILAEKSSYQVSIFLMNLCELLWDDSVNISGTYLHDIFIQEDKGIRITKFGNAAGFNWEGAYRYFIIKDNKGNNQIISLAVLYGYLIVAIDDYKKKHNSLQLYVENFICKEGEYNLFYHNGRLTLGKNGMMPWNEVIDFVKEAAPELVNEEGKINLGKVIYTTDITWDQSETKDFFGRLIKYSLIRDGYRKQKTKKLGKRKKARRKTT